MRRFLALIILAICIAPRPAIAADSSLDFNQSLFTILAALNAAGYDTDLDSPQNSPLRKQVREYLAKQKIPVLSEIRDFYKYRSPSIAPYISLALSVTGPPDFPFKTRTVDVPPDAVAYEKFIPLLIRFYQEAKIEALWPRVQGAYEQALVPYHDPLSRSILEVNSYLRTPSGGYLGRNFQVYIDLLAAPNQVQTRSYGDDYFVVVTPSAEPKFSDIRHAYLHFVVEPLFSKYGLDLMKKAALIDYAATAPGLEESYKNDFILLSAECFIKALESRLDHKPASVNDALHEGFILTPFFAEALAAYEKQPVAMKLFFPDIVTKLDSARERQRLESITFTAKPKSGSTPATAPPPPLTAAGKTLEQAEQAYNALDYTNAKTLFVHSLEQAGEGPDHARAYYGLSRIALRENNPENAELLLQKTLEMQPDPPIKAWAIVYLGRLADARGAHKEAAKHYQTALDTPGASQQALKAAEKGLQESLKK